MSLCCASGLPQGGLSFSASKIPLVRSFTAAAVAFGKKFFQTNVYLFSITPFAAGRDEWWLFMDERLSLGSDL